MGLRIHGERKGGIGMSAVVTEGCFSEEGHDHQGCVRMTLSAAEEICRHRGVRLTRIRKKVLELVIARHEPVGAYDILERLQKEGRAAPPTVYRALDFLLENGLVHRLESFNAYVGCNLPNRPHVGQFLICGSCKAMAELHDEAVSDAICRSAEKAGFLVQRQTVENIGLCPKCR